MHSIVNRQSSAQSRCQNGLRDNPVQICYNPFWPATPDPISQNTILEWKPIRQSYLSRRWGRKEEIWSHPFRNGCVDNTYGRTTERSGQRRCYGQKNPFKHRQTHFLSQASWNSKCSWYCVYSMIGTLLRMFISLSSLSSYYRLCRAIVREVVSIRLSWALSIVLIIWVSQPSC